jgi:hypothetical protein
MMTGIFSVEVKMMNTVLAGSVNKMYIIAIKALGEGR